MLKNIRLHIEQDEEKQELLESEFAELITQRHKQNINAFQRNIPSLLPYASNKESSNIALMVNKSGQPNIVDYGQGRVLYGFNPELEVQQDVLNFIRHPVSVDMKANSHPDNDSSVNTIAKIQAALPPAAKKNEPITVVVLGLGLGLHLKHLLSGLNVKNLIVYEPEEQYFKCSALSTDWKEIFDLAKSKDTGLFFQIGKDSRDIVADMIELQSHLGVDSFYLYQHYHHPVFNSVRTACDTRSWQSLVSEGVSFTFDQESNEYCPPWTPPVDIESLSDIEDTSLLNNNLDCLKRYFPDIYEQFKSYKPKIWIPAVSQNGTVNLINRSHLAAWYSEDSENDCLLNFENFESQPTKDGLVLGYTGEKLKHYLHYKFVKKAEQLLESTQEELGALPPEIKSFIMFGLGVGYQLDAFVKSHKVENLFICEPNPDFFYASLHAIDWAKILQKLDDAGGRLYINIGDQGANLFRDLLNQFYAIGPYILANTFFYQSYYNAELNDSIAQLREQLQIVISMGEYFDHARYGIVHTHEGVKRGYHHLVKNPSSKLKRTQKDTPVFFVGNGPSLDYSIDAIKEWKDNAIIVSCGTALQVLRKNGIVPDFHAEIEQNRSTYDWSSRINDFDFLSEVTLLSCNGIHPDTGELFKDVYVAFKEGESSTVSTLSILGEENYEVLQFAFPTVTNFAVNLFVKLGFNQLYLFGVDLGFSQPDFHHSKQSGYYNESGKQLYDYREKNNTSLVVKGNFKPSVFTKHEFKVSRMILEQSLASHKVDCYNTSDGAHISGSIPLDINNLLIVSTTEEKTESLATVKAECFTQVGKGEFESLFNNKFDSAVLLRELNVFSDRLHCDAESLAEAEAIIEKQKEMLFASYQHGRSLLFYLLYGTMNFANAYLSKLLNSARDELRKVELFNQGLATWRESFSDIHNAILNHLGELDSSSAIGERRVKPCLQKFLKDKRLLIITSSEQFVKAFEASEKHFETGAELLYQAPDEVSHENFSNTDGIVIYFQQETEKECKDTLERMLPNVNQSIPILVLSKSFNHLPLEKYKNLSWMQALLGFMEDDFPLESQQLSHAMLALQYVLSHKSGEPSIFKYMIPKYFYAEQAQLTMCLSEVVFPDYHCYDLGWVVGISPELVSTQFILPNGSRFSYLGRGISSDYWTERKISSELLRNKKSNFAEWHPYLLESE